MLVRDFRSDRSFAAMPPSYIGTEQERLLSGQLELVQPFIEAGAQLSQSVPLGRGIMKLIKCGRDQFSVCRRLGLG
jgi:hypothetical protein